MTIGLCDQLVLTAKTVPFEAKASFFKVNFFLLSVTKYQQKKSVTETTKETEDLQKISNKLSTSFSCHLIRLCTKQRNIHFWFSRFSIVFDQFTLGKVQKIRVMSENTDQVL